MKASCERPVGDVEQAVAAMMALTATVRTRFNVVKVDIWFIEANINPLAVYRYQHEAISLAKAASLAGVSWAQMKEILLEQGIDAFWLLKIHTGRFGPLNLQPYYSILLGIFTLVVILSGLSLWFSRPRRSVVHN